MAVAPIHVSHAQPRTWVPIRARVPLLFAASFVVLVVAFFWNQNHGGSGLAGGSEQARGTDAGCALIDHEHATWSRLVRQYVRDGFVDYQGLKRNGEQQLDAYLQSLQAVCRGNYDDSTRSQQLAFWINAYNAYTVKLILKHYPLQSIRNIGVLPGAAFRESFIALSKLVGDGQALMSLNDIEHEVLRKKFLEPRIHFAIVCASKGCPSLRSEPYRARDLEAQLTDAAQRFVRDPSKNRFDPATRTLHLSAIFDWFHEDFEKAASTVPTFVARYAEPDVAAALLAGNVQVEHLDYDWSLNGR